MQGATRSCVLSLAVAIAALCVTASVGHAQRPSAPPPDLATMDLEQLMKVEVVVAASKRAQQTRDVPSFVSIVTAAEIRRHGYRTLGDVLKTLPSFYVTDDRNYSYVGVRGFHRPGDYSSRVLLLVNGLRTNNGVYGQAYVGQEFMVDVDLIERIEVIRGPSAALYGSNAFFAVINVVTKEGRSYQGGEIAGTAASFDTYAARGTYGRHFENDVEVLASATLADSKGQSLYFPEFDAPATNNGIFADGDRESSRKFLASVGRGGFSFQAAHSSREKGIPTASFATIFNDPRSQTVDALTLGTLNYNGAFAEGTAVSTRLHAGRWAYEGAYAYNPATAPNRDLASDQWWGADFDAARRLGPRHFVTLGAEFRQNDTQMKNFDPDPFVLYTDQRQSSVRWGSFAQDEIKLFQPLTVYAGVRLDHYPGFSATSPRAGLIYTPDAATTFKALAGRAFRAPNEFELHFENFQFKANPLVGPERIVTLELIGQRMVGGGLQISASAFRNRISALISQRVDSTDNLLSFDNAEEIESKGIELGLDMNHGYGLTGRLSYALQRTDDRATGIELTNSPRHMAKLQLLAPLNRKDLTAGMDAQYLSGRRTLAGNVAPGYVVANLTLLAPTVFKRVAMSAMLYNVLDRRYGNPGSEDHAQDIILENGRSFRVKTTLRY